MPDLSDEALSTARAARVAAHARACAMLRTHDTRLFFLDLSQWLASGSLCRARHRDMTLPALAVEGLSGLYGLVSDQGEDIQTVSDEDRHDIRKAAKKLRYSAEFLASLYDERKQRKARVRFLAALELLQDYLGDLNDASVRPALLAELGIDAPPVDEADQHALLKGAARAMEGLREQGAFWERG
jgi:triphosphatase